MLSNIGLVFVDIFQKFKLLGEFFMWFHLLFTYRLWCSQTLEVLPKVMLCQNNQLVEPVTVKLALGPIKLGPQWWFHNTPWERLEIYTPFFVVYLIFGFSYFTMIKDMMLCFLLTGRKDRYRKKEISRSS